MTNSYGLPAVFLYFNKHRIDINRENLVTNSSGFHEISVFRSYSNRECAFTLNTPTVEIS